MLHIYTYLKTQVVSILSNNQPTYTIYIYMQQHIVGCMKILPIILLTGKLNTFRNSLKYSENKYVLNSKYSI